MINYVLKNFLLIISIVLFTNFSFSDDSPLPKGTPESVGISADRLKRIESVFNTGIAEGRIPGAVIGIARKGKLVFFKAFGMQNAAKNVPMSTDSIFRIYSMTKPLVSIGAMILHEEGKLYLSEPVEKYIPEFKNMKVAKTSIQDTNSNAIAIIDAKRKIKIHDLLLHTSGLTYGFYGNSPAKNILKASGIGNLNKMDIDLKQYVFELSKLPLAYQPGEHWEYGRSTDVLGHLIEIVSENSLDNFMVENVFKPLNMKDTDFWVPEKKWPRIAEPLDNKGEPELINIKKQPKLLSAGHGLASTVGDYIRFCQMMLDKGILDNTRVLGSKTVEYISSNHLGKDYISRKGPYYLPGPGYGFGLGFAVREDDGVSPWPGSIGEYFWGGYAGTYFWIDPKEELVVVSMTQSVINRVYYRMILRNLVYQSLIN